MTARLDDRLGRPLESLRISVTDRCNLRCTYCMPKAAFAHHAFLGQESLLTFDEIERLARIFVARGVRKIRLTGGEPLLRPHLDDLVRRLLALPGLAELALSTNGLLLAEKAASLRAAGLRRINLSLDAIDDGVFGAINGMGQPATQVLKGLDAALAAGLSAKVNMVVERGVNEAQILPMARHFASRGVPLRFIEFMDVGNRNAWQPGMVVPSAELAQRIGARWPMHPVAGNYHGEVAQRWQFDDGGGEVGFISSVSQPFCGACSRARLSSEGKFYTCLFATQGLDLRAALRAGAGDAELANLIRGSWLGRTDRYSELRDELRRAGPHEKKIEMYYIGG